MSRKISKKKLFGIILLVAIIAFAIMLVWKPEWAYAIRDAVYKQVWVPLSNWGAGVWAGVSANPVWQTYGIVHSFSFIWGVVVIGAIVLFYTFRSTITTKFTRHAPSTPITSGSSSLRSTTPAGATTRPEVKETVPETPVEEPEKTEQTE